MIKSFGRTGRERERGCSVMSELTGIAILELVLVVSILTHHIDMANGDTWFSLMAIYLIWIIVLPNNSLFQPMHGHSIWRSIPFRINSYVLFVCVRGARARERKRRKHFDPVYEESFWGFERFSFDGFSENPNYIMAQLTQYLRWWWHKM